MTHCIALYREAKNLTQDDFAALLGKFDGVSVAGNTVARWERGESLPRKKYRDKIHEVTGIPADRIFTDCMTAANVREAAE